MATADLTVENGTLSNVISGNGGVTWTATLTPTDHFFGATNMLTPSNLGADTVSAGAGNDTVGGGGNAFLSGDLGSDTLSGGADADIFHSFGRAGIDLVADFNFAEGDRVRLGPGTVYTVSQLGEDTHILMQGGGEMVPAHVQFAGLSRDWIGV
jgi:Ca2+-binding RTX toxin-like protein